MALAKEQPASTTPGRSLLWTFLRRLLIGWLGFVIFSIAILCAAAAFVAVRQGKPFTEVMELAWPQLGTILSSMTGIVVDIIPFWLALLALQVVVHEAGHLVAGYLAGFSFLFASIGPVQLRRTIRRPGVKLSFGSTGTAGGALCVPTGGGRVRQRVIAMVAGGPLASLALGVSALLLQDTADPAVTGFAGSVAITSFMLVIGNLLPLKIAEGQTDGARLIQLIQGGPAAEQYCDALLLLGQSVGESRPRDWDAKLIERLAEAEYSSAGAGNLGNMMAFCRALDRGDIEGAGVYMERRLQTLHREPEIIQPLVVADGAFYHSFYRRDPETARRIMRRNYTHAAKRHRYMLLRAEAAILLAEGKREEAAAKAQEGLSSLEREGECDRATLEQEREWLRAIMDGEFPRIYNEGRTVTSGV